MGLDAGPKRSIDELRYDSVVMLTRSNWRTELRSNRYHYASRFARRLPVLFVQADLPWLGCEQEATELAGVTVLHVARFFGWRQTEILARAIERRRLQRPIVWVYEHRFLDFVRRSEAAAKVYHATEDYFSAEFYKGADHQQIRAVVAECDLLVAVSQGVLEDYRTQGGYQGRHLLLTNGCDFGFWQTGPRVSAEERVAIYQGGISSKIDFGLLETVIDSLPDWEFRFCGRTFPDDPKGCKAFARLRKRANVSYLGNLSVVDLRVELQKASVGLIPLLQNDWIQNRTFSLKGFEYVACGLPVVGVPMKAFLPHPELFSFATDADGFVAKIPVAAASRNDGEALTRRAAAAKKMDYEDRFAELWSTLNTQGFATQGDSWSLHPRQGIGLRPRDRLEGAAFTVLGGLPRVARSPVVRVISAATRRARKLGVRAFGFVPGWGSFGNRR